MVDPDTAIGTPGNHAPAKRGRKLGGSSHVGDKSTFSITPFLNRTMSLAPASPESEKEAEPPKKRKAEDDEDDEPDADVGAEAETEVEEEAGTPSVATKKSKKPAPAPKEPKTKPKALAPASSAKQNRKPPAKRSKAVVPTLEKVTEESEIVEEPKKAAAPETDQESSENQPADSAPAYKEKTTTTTVPVALVPKLKSTSQKQPRKSLLSFAAFTDEPAPAEKKKKRKLLGANSSGLGKTLFDEEDGDKLPTKPIPGRGLFGKRNLLGGKRGAGNASLMVSDDAGFAFSPLKKDKKAAALAQSMLGN